MSPGTESEGSSVTRQYKSREERRAEIVEATLAILAEEGMHAWTTSALADRVGVSEATLFKHFADKDEMLTEALRYQAKSLRDRLAAFEGRGRAWDRAAGLLRHVFDYLEETDGGPLLILLGHAGRIRPEMQQEELWKTAELFTGRLERLFEEALEERDGGGPVEPAALADLALAVVQSSALRWMVSGRERRPADIASPMIGVLGACLYGCGPQQEGEGS